MTKKFLTISIFCLFLIAEKSIAQQGQVGFTYSIGFGLGDLGDYISQPSFRGITFDWSKNVNPNLTVGVEFGWNLFYERKDYDTYTNETAALSGVQYRYNNQFPMLGTVNYVFSPDQLLKPYAGLGIGTMYSLRNTDMGQWTLEEDAWHFALKPEVGILYEVGGGTHLKAAAKYYTGFSAGDLDTQSYFALNLGVAFVP